MYSKEFCKIYNEYGWDYFSLTMGNSILRYFEKNNKKIEKHLDLACGTGTLCDYYYKNGIKTYGIDISKDMIKLAREKNKNISFKIDDMTTYKDKMKYDLITITCDAFNHILDETNLDAMFSNIYEMLDENGYLIFDILNKDKIGFNIDIISDRENDIKVNYYITQKSNLINTNVKIFKNECKVYEYNVLEKLYDIEFINNILNKHNFTILKIDDKILDEKQRFTDKLYIICKKSN